MAEIEVSAGEAFRATPHAAVADDPPTARWLFEPLQVQGLAWVAADDGALIGFACCEAFEDALHLWQLAVRADRQGRGAGRALVAACSEEARRRGLPAVTLTTFRDVVFNAHFYERLGFRERTNARLDWTLQREARSGLDPAHRCAMVLDL